MALRDLGADVDVGAGVAAAQRVFQEAGVPAGAPLRERHSARIKEKIADSGIELLRSQFEVDLGVDWDDGELAERIGEYDAILIRSATKLTADLIDRADRMKVIGRAGIGVDNVTCR